jgi:coenzyme F420-reducing hydrogenase delta subunit/Pyruvate/2-oxoacid:ferredoxin oxidoreductase delta subunit
MVVPPRRADGLERDKVAAADAAAMALVLRLSQESVTHFRDVSAVDETLCGGCASCVRTCAFGACTLDGNGVSHVDIRRCRACGKCVVGCPVGARDIMSSPHDYLLEAVERLSQVEAAHEKVIGFMCSGCGYPAADRGADFVAERGKGYSADFLPLRIPCGGRLDALYVLEAFKTGFDAVNVYRCREGHCHNLIGNLDMDRRINLLRVVLRSRHIDDARLRIVDISPFEGERFVESVEQSFSTATSLSGLNGGHR